MASVYTVFQIEHCQCRIGFICQLPCYVGVIFYPQVTNRVSAAHRQFVELLDIGDQIVFDFVKNLLIVFFWLCLKKCRLRKLLKKPERLHVYFSLQEGSYYRVSLEMH